MSHYNVKQMQMIISKLIIFIIASKEGTESHSLH